MATDTRALNTATADDATFRTAIGQVRAALAAVGMVQTADTGQINPATVTKPGAINTAAGFEIWRFNDASQGARPISIKIWYGVGGIAIFNMWVQVGFATDGAGNLVGIASGQKQLTVPSSQSDNIYTTAADGRFTMRFRGANSGVGDFFIHVERPRNADGTIADIGVYVHLFYHSGNGMVQFVPWTGAASSASSHGVTWGFTNNTLIGGFTVFGADIAVCPIWCVAGKFYYTSLVCHFQADIPAGSQFTINHLGTNRNFWALWLGTGSSSAMQMAMVWE